MIGRPNDFVDVLSGKDRDHKFDDLIFNFHGDKGRFCMTVLDHDVYEDKEPKGEFFDHQDVVRYANLKNVKVIAAGCTLGTQQLAMAFLKSGCHSYIGPHNYIDGNSNLMFLIKFMYEIIDNKADRTKGI